MGRGKTMGQSRGQSMGSMGQPMGQGSGGVSPVMMTCRDDLAQLCGGQLGMPGVQC